MIAKYSKVQMTETTQKSDRSFTLLKLCKDKISPLAHRGMDVTNRHSGDGLGHVDVNKPWLLYETIRNTQLKG